MAPFEPDQAWLDDPSLLVSLAAIRSSLDFEGEMAARAAAIRVMAATSGAPAKAGKGKGGTTLSGMEATR